VFVLFGPKSSLAAPSHHSAMPAAELKSDFHPVSYFG